jgi:hypothetical protein
LPKSRLAIVALALACALTLTSVLVERTGPETVQSGNLCGKASDAPCYKQVLKGGFPIAYLFDASGVSVENRLAFGEDDLSLVGLALDFVIYFAIVFLSALLITGRRSAVAPTVGRGDA